MPSFQSDIPNNTGSSLGGLSVGVGIAGAALGAIGAIQNNKRISQQVRQNYETISNQQTQAQRIGYQQSFVLGQQSTYQEGAFLNSISGRSGASYRAIVGQMARDNSLNSQNIQENTANEITSLQAEKLNVYNSARGQMQSVIGQAASVGGSLFNQAISVQGALAQSKIADTAANEAKAAREIFASGREDQIFALTQRNLPASVIQGGNLDGLINRDYTNYLTIQQMQLDAARAARDANRGLYR